MNKNKLINAYSDLMAHIYEAMDDTLHSFADALDIAKEKTSKISELSNDELDRVSGFVKRDIEQAAHGLSEKADLSEKDYHDSLAEWFKFDIELIENFTLDAFLSIADKTRIELAKLEQLAQTHTYHKGDITSPGTFICDACGKEIAFKTPSEIPECPACHADTFIRI
ncbi:MAG: zinc ribbon-containing protein [Methylovulum sp.]|nr:zinc ribbon-containing protein [Methylovulum sp.]